MDRLALYEQGEWLIGFKLNEEFRAIRVDRDDLAQCGRMGLWKATEKYDPHYRNKDGKSIKFESYAVYWVRAFMWDFVKKEKRHEVSDWKTFDAPTSAPGGRTWKDLTPSEKWDKQAKGGILRGDHQERIEGKVHEDLAWKQWFDSLPKEVRQIVALRYGVWDGWERSLKEVGKILGYSGEWVRQLESLHLRP